MGLSIEVSGADYSANNVNDDNISFDIMSNKVENVYYDGVELSLQNSGSSGNFEFAASKEITSATVTMRDTNPLPNVVVIGGTSAGNAIVLYLTGNGQIREFKKDGTAGDILVTLTGSLPDLPKTVPGFITHGTTAFTISYNGYSRTINYSLIPGFVDKAVGVLVTGNALTYYDFVVTS